MKTTKQNNNGANQNGAKIIRNLLSPQKLLRQKFPEPKKVYPNAAHIMLMLMMPITMRAAHHALVQRLMQTPTKKTQEKQKRRGVEKNEYPKKKRYEKQTIMSDR